MEGIVNGEKIMLEWKTCEVCGRTFLAKTAKAKYCGSRCTGQAANMRYGHKTGKPDDPFKMQLGITFRIPNKFYVRLTKQIPLGDDDFSKTTEKLVMSLAKLKVKNEGWTLTSKRRPIK